MNSLPKNFSLGQIRMLWVSLFLGSLTLVGCGTSTYDTAVKKSQPELEKRGKFASLGPEYVRFPTFPIAFRIPKMFLEDDAVSQRWVSTNGQAVKLNTKDPFELKNDPNFRGIIRAEMAIPSEFNEALLNQGHQGTYLCEYKVMVPNDPTNPSSVTETKQSLLMAIWMFDASPQSRLKPPNDLILLNGVKGRGKGPARVLWEDDVIDAATTPENSSPAPIPAKLARFPIISKFMVGRDGNRVPVEKKGYLRLWSFRLDKYQVFVAFRVAAELAEGDAPEFAQDAENPNSDKLLELGRAVIGTMTIVADTAEPEAKKK